MKQPIVYALLFIGLPLLNLQAEDPPLAETKPREASSEMQRLFKAFVGRWSLTENVEPNERMPNGATGKGEEIYTVGPGGNSIIEDVRLKEAAGEISGLGVGWWDAKAGGYRGLWCDSENRGGCILMARLAKWEGDQFVLGDEYERDGKKFIFKEVFSEITPTSFTQTLYEGEAGKELKRIVTIHATKARDAAASPTVTPK